MNQVFPTTITADEARRAAEEYREAEMALQKIESDIKVKQAEIAAQYERDQAIFTKMKDDATAKLQLYVNEYPDTLGSKRSTDFMGLTIGFRKGAAKLVTTGKNTWDKVLAKIKANAEAYGDYLKVKEELDKTALKKADAATLKTLGVALEQEDSFFVKL